MTNKRLGKIVELFDNNYVYDIGSDHAKLVKELIVQNKVSGATICEINQEPLNNAKKTLLPYENCQFYLSDGLSEVSSIDQKDVGIVIAGMGGNMIVHILEAALNKIDNAVLYLQPNNNDDKLRRFLNANNFMIDLEVVVCDNNIYYNIIKAKKGSQSLSNEEFYLGKNILKDNNFLSKVSNDFNYLDNLVKKISDSKNQNVAVLEKYEVYKNYMGNNEIKEIN